MKSKGLHNIVEPHQSISRSFAICVLGTLLLHPAIFLGQANDPAKKWVGDSPTTALPIATDLPLTLTKKNVSPRHQKVGDWQLARAEQGFDQDWTFAALYAGFMSVPNAANGKTYREAMMRMERSFAGNSARDPRMLTIRQSARLISSLLRPSRSGNDGAHPQPHGCDAAASR